MLDIIEAADYLGTTERHMRNLIARRTITHVKVGRKIRFRKADLDAYVQSHTVSAGGAK